MNLEGIASPPPNQRPEIRYATLHRAIERGLDGERAWADLVGVCAELGRQEEAVAALRRVHEPSLRRQAVNRARVHGVRLDAATRTAARDHTSAMRIDESRMPVMEHLGEAIRFLFVDHMPLTLIVSTVTFPVVIGFGGFLRASLGPSLAWITVVLTALPALAVLGLLGHLSRETVRDARRGLIDPPEVPQNAELARGAGKFAGDLLAVLGVAALPTLLAALLAPTAVTIAIGAVTAVLLPWILALRMTEGTWRCFEPMHVLKTVQHDLPAFLNASFCTLVLFAPAILTIALTYESSLDLCLSVAGSLAGVPMILSARLLGQVLQERDRAQRRKLAQRATEARLLSRADAAEAKPEAPKRRRSRTAAARKAASSERRVRPARPEQEATTADDRPRRQTAAQTEGPPTKGSPKKRTPARRGAPTRPATGRPTARQPVAARSDRTASRPGLSDQPDLTGIPGATIVRRR